MRTFLACSSLWNEQGQSYLVSNVGQCDDCKASSSLPNRAFRSHYWTYNLVGLCMDTSLRGVTLCHAMHVATRCSAAHVVSTYTIEDAIYAFRLIWISQFWPPEHIHADGTLQTDALTPLLLPYHNKLRPVPPRRNEENMIEPRQGVIRSIFLCLRHANPDSNVSLCAIQAT